MKILKMLALGLLVGCTGRPVLYNQAQPLTSVEVPNFDPDGMSSVYSKFYQHAEAGDKTVFFNINSNGGSVFGGLDLIKAIEDVKKSKGIHTVCVVDTHAFSMGFIFLQSGACDERYMTERSLLLAHNVSASADGNAEDMEKMAKVVREISLAMANLVCSRMHMPVESYLDRIRGKDWIFGYKEAIAVGAVDGVYPAEALPPRE